MISSGYRYFRSALAIVSGIVATGVLVLATAPEAEAAFSLRLSTAGGASTTVVDEGVNDSSVGIAGFITFFGGVGNFTLNVTIGSSKPRLGTAEYPEMNLTSVNANNFFGAPDILTIEITDTDFIGPTPLAKFKTVVNGTRIPGTLSLDSYIDTSNTEFGTATSLAAFGPLGPGPSNAETSDTVPTSAPYSLTMVARIDHLTVPVVDMTTFDANIAVPEPQTLTLLGIGLLGIGLLFRRKPGSGGVRA